MSFIALFSTRPQCSPKRKGSTSFFLYDDIEDQGEKVGLILIPTKGSEDNLNIQCSLCKPLGVGFLFTPCMQSIWNNRVFCMPSIVG